jgi:hypothetical protein
MPVDPPSQDDLKKSAREMEEFIDEHGDESGLDPTH